MISILDKNFKYVPSSQTDIRKTFARIKKKLVEETATKKKNVTPIRRGVARAGEKS